MSKLQWLHAAPISYELPNRRASEVQYLFCHIMGHPVLPKHKDLLVLRENRAHYPLPLKSLLYMFRWPCLRKVGPEDPSNLTHFWLCDVDSFPFFSWIGICTILKHYRKKTSAKMSAAIISFLPKNSILTSPSYEPKSYWSAKCCFSHIITWPIHFLIGLTVPSPT